MLKLDGVTVAYGKKAALSCADISFDRGLVTVVTGPNGCGKSTLLKAAAGVEKPSAGAVLLDGSPLAEYEPLQRAAKISYLPQNRRVPNISVEKLVMHGRFPHLKFPRHYTREDREITLEAMREMGIEDLADRNAGDISGGERQKAYLAMAFAQQTDAILLDEPDTFLDIDHRLMLWDLMGSLAARGKAVAVVSHDLAQALGAADRLAVMAAGEIISIGSPEDVKDDLGGVFNVAIENTDGYYMISKKKRTR